MIAHVEIIELLLKAESFEAFQQNAKTTLLDTLERTLFQLTMNGDNPDTLQQVEDLIEKFRVM